ncbi:MAG: ketoacyl-ACP synthase III [Acidimicrobiia bacterium]|nr:ketoacyl-ACP synthase III [Acidimicrobiia bacterium]
MRGAVITGVGIALPDKVVSNDDLAARIDTNDSWIVDRTGIKERHIGGSTASLASEAGAKAMAAAGVTADDIDLVILATTSPDRMVPATSATVQGTLGLKCGAFDVNSACTGWVSGLIAAHGIINLGGSVDRVLVIGSETLSRIVDWDDRSTAILFADGAGAAVLEGVDGPGQLLGWHMGADGNGEGLLYCDHGGCLIMDGKGIYRMAVRVMVESSMRSLEMAGLTPADVDFVVPHQANLRIIEAANQRLGIPMDRCSIVLDHTGNTSSATVPTALEDALRKGRIKDGDVVLFVGFGAGMTWASALVRWGGTPA